MTRLTPNTGVRPPAPKSPPGTRRSNLDAPPLAWPPPPPASPPPVVAAEAETRRMPSYRQPAEGSTEQRFASLHREVEEVRELQRRTWPQLALTVFVGAVTGSALAHGCTELLSAAMANAQPRVLEEGSSTPPHGAEAAPQSSAAWTPSSSGADSQRTRVLLERALLERVQLPWTRRDGSHPFVEHCRRAREGCPRRVARLAYAFERAEHETGVDAWLLAAIAFHESGLNVEAIGARGEHGVMQLMPGSPWGREAARRCRVSPSDCDAIEIEVAARVVAHALTRCGTEEGALIVYNTGRGCTAEGDGPSSAEPPGRRYARTVLSLRNELRGGAS